MRDPHYVTLLELCNDVLRRFWTVAAAVVVCAAGAALLSLGRQRTYTSIVSFVPEARQSLPAGVEVPNVSLDRLSGRPSLGRSSLGRSSLGGSSLSGPSLGGPSFGGPSLSAPSLGRPSLNSTSRATPLSGLGGTLMSLSAPAAVQPLDPAFYEAALRSRELLMTVAGSRVPMSTPTGVGMVTAADFFGLPPGPAMTRTEDAARRLARHLEIVSDDRTSIVTVSVQTVDPVFSQSVAARLLDVLMEQNRRMADSRAEAQVAFLARVTAEAKQELTLTQNRLAEFLESNRAYVRASPVALAFRRLDNDVLEKRRQYADLALQLERAKLDRSRATQLITVVSQPEVAPRPDPRGLLRSTLAGAVGGGVVAVLLVLSGAQVRRLRSAGYGDLAVLETQWRRVTRRASVERRASMTATTAPSGAQSR